MSANSSTYPYDTIVYITDVIGGITYQASGVLIAPDEVLTAAHVVYSTGVGTATNIKVSAGYEDGAAPYGTVAGVSFHYNAVNDANDQITNQQSQSDFAVIHLASPLTNVGTMALEANFAGGPATVSGYPGSAGGAQIDQSENFTVAGGYTLLTGRPLGPGSSGGPVWVTGANGQPQIVGLVSSGTSRQGYFVQLTSADIAEIDNWVASDDGTVTVASPSAPAPSGLGAVLLAQINSAVAAGLLIAETATQAAGAPTLPAGKNGELLINQAQSVIVSAGYQAVVDTAVGATTVALSAGTNVSVVASGGALEMVTGVTSGTLAGGSGGTLFFASPNAGPWVVSLAGGANTIAAMASNVTVAAGTGANLLFVDGGSDSIASTGSDTVVALGGAVTISAATNHALVFGIGGAMTFLAGSASSTVVGGTAGTSLVGGTGGMVYFGLGASSYLGGGGADTVLGGTGTLIGQGGGGDVLMFGGAAGGNRLSSGSGSATMIGGGAGDILSATGAGHSLLVAGAGSETLNGAGATAANVFQGGSGADLIVGGSGDDILLAGTGNATLTGGGGNDDFVFQNGPATVSDVITDFNASHDSLVLAGFGIGAAASVYQSQILRVGGTQITLPNGSTVILSGVSSLSASSIF